MIDLNKKHIEVRIKPNGVYVFALCKGQNAIPFAWNTTSYLSAKNFSIQYAKIIENCPVQIFNNQNEVIEEIEAN